jgi:hypothetical protein
VAGGVLAPAVGVRAADEGPSANAGRALALPQPGAESPLPRSSSAFDACARRSAVRRIHRRSRRLAPVTFRAHRLRHQRRLERRAQLDCRRRIRSGHSGCRRRGRVHGRVGGFRGVRDRATRRRGARGAAAEGSLAHDVSGAAAPAAALSQQSSLDATDESAWRVVAEWEGRDLPPISSYGYFEDLLYGAAWLQLTSDADELTPRQAERGGGRLHGGAAAPTRRRRRRRTRSS